jgi:arsenate reductase (glutaredoxin)
MLKFYHNPHCKKSRTGLKHLQVKGIPFEIIEYIKNPLTEAQITKLLIKLNLRPQEIFRKQEDYYKKNLKDKDFHDHEWIRILSQNPKLIQRPIIETKYRAVIGDPIENIELLIK